MVGKNNIYGINPRGLCKCTCRAVASNHPVISAGWVVIGGFSTETGMRASDKIPYTTAVSLVHHYIVLVC